MCSFKITKHAFYIQVFERFGQRIIRQKNLRPNKWILHHDNVPSWATLKSLLAMTQKAVLEHPPYCRAKLAPCDFNFPKPITWRLTQKCDNGTECTSIEWLPMKFLGMADRAVETRVIKPEDKHTRVKVSTHRYGYICLQHSKFGHLIFWPLRLDDCCAHFAKNTK
jgi:hypothetical protein